MQQSTSLYPPYDLYHLSEVPPSTSFDPKTPLVAVDAVILQGTRVLMISRKYPPLGMALPGGMVDVGETLVEAVTREVQEEVSLTKLPAPKYLGYLDDPYRDSRRHVISHGFSFVLPDDLYVEPVAGDDAARAGFVELSSLMDRPPVLGHGEFIKRAIAEHSRDGSLSLTYVTYGFGW